MMFNNKMNLMRNRKMNHKKKIIKRKRKLKNLIKKSHYLLSFPESSTHKKLNKNN